MLMKYSSYLLQMSKATHGLLSNLIEAYCYTFSQLTIVQNKMNNNFPLCFDTSLNYNKKAKTKKKCKNKHHNSMFTRSHFKEITRKNERIYMECSPCEFSIITDAHNHPHTLSCLICEFWAHEKDFQTYIHHRNILGWFYVIDKDEDKLKIFGLICGSS